MRKYILAVSLGLMLTSLMPLCAKGSVPNLEIQELIDADNINISVNGSTLTVTGASGSVLEVVSLTGRKVATVKIEASSQRVELNIPKGCYILKIGKVVRKVSIR